MAEKSVSQEALAIAKKQGSLGYQIKKNRASYAMMAPYFILFFLFTVLPVLMSIVLSFTDFNMLEMPNFVGWRNYVKLFLEDNIFTIALKNTLIFAVITGPVSYLLCLLFAWIINEFKGFLRAFLTLIFYAPSICGNAYLVWNLILTGDRYGYLNGILLKLGIINEPILWTSDGGQEHVRGGGARRRQEPLAGAVVCHAPGDEAAVNVRRGDADHAVLRGGRYLHQPCR
jgi:multiple sugar transport system permease protein